MCYVILLHAVDSSLCIVILINMCCIQCIVLYFNFFCNYFLKFIVYKINSKMVKSVMMMLTERED
jgi:hypothetical protein